MWKKGFIPVFLLLFLVLLAGCGAFPSAGETAEGPGQTPAPADVSRSEKNDHLSHDAGPAAVFGRQDPAQGRPSGTASPQNPQASQPAAKAKAPVQSAKEAQGPGRSAGSAPSAQQAPSQTPSQGPSKATSQAPAKETPAEPSKEASLEAAKSGGPAEEPPPAVQERQTVTIAIQGDEERGTILPPTEVAIAEGDTVLAVLQKVAKEKNIHLEFSGQGAYAYVAGIDHLYEFDRGPMSGWVYLVNGNLLNKSAGAAPVRPGDRIEWRYTEKLGNDLDGKR